MPQIQISPNNEEDRDLAENLQTLANEMVRLGEVTMPNGWETDNQPTTYSEALRRQNEVVEQQHRRYQEYIRAEQRRYSLPIRNPSGQWVTTTTNAPSLNNYIINPDDMTFAYSYNAPFVMGVDNEESGPLEQLVEGAGSMWDEGRKDIEALDKNSSKGVRYTH